MLNIIIILSFLLIFNLSIVLPFIQTYQRYRNPYLSLSSTTLKDIHVSAIFVLCFIVSLIPFFHRILSFHPFIFLYNYDGAPFSCSVLTMSFYFLLYFFHLPFTTFPFSHYVILIFFWSVIILPSYIYIFPFTISYFYHSIILLGFPILKFSNNFAIFLFLVSVFMSLFHSVILEYFRYYLPRSFIL